jgi:hypothetical protein
MNETDRSGLPVPPRPLHLLPQNGHTKRTTTSTETTPRHQKKTYSRRRTSVSGDPTSRNAFAVVDDTIDSPISCSTGIRVSARSEPSGSSQVSPGHSRERIKFCQSRWEIGSSGRRKCIRRNRTLKSSWDWTSNFESFVTAVQKMRPPKGPSRTSLN